MKAVEFGAGRRETVLLLHGGGLSWWNYREAAQLLEPYFHVILPVLDGHAGSGRAFVSMENSASELLSWIDEQFGGQILLAGGLSLGGQILLEMLARRRDFCRFALVESASVLPSRIAAAMIDPAVRLSYRLMRSRSFARLQFRYLRLKEDLFEEYYRDTCGISQSDLAAFLKASTLYSMRESISRTIAKVHVFAGGKETGRILRSAEMIGNAVPSCTVQILPGLRHGEFSVCRAEEYARAIREITGV